MVAAPPETVREVVLLGGGHSHVEVLRRFGMSPHPGIRLTLISQDYFAPYSGMLPGHVAGHYTFHESHIDLAPLCRFAGCRLIRDEVVGVDLDNRRVLVVDRPAVLFEVLSINTGSTPSMASIPGAAEFAIPAKPVDQFLKGWETIQSRAAKGFRVVVIGGGAGGVELSLSMQHRLQGLLGRDELQFTLATDEPDVMLSHNGRVREKMNRVLQERGIRVLTSQRATRVTATEVEFGATSIPYDALILVTDASAPAWIRESGLATDDKGFVAVDETLRSVSHPFVFAAGDIAAMTKSPRAKSGVFAVRQGPYLHENLVRTVHERELIPFDPQNQFLSLISTGDQYAIASRGRWALEGEWVWRWKNRIDTQWMGRYRDFPMMQSAEAMHCGGCGCKIGPETLTRVFERLRASELRDGLLGFDSLDDAAIVEPPPGQVAVHTVDFFRQFLDDPYVFGQVAANHCLSDVYAMGAAPHNALAQVILPYDATERHEDLLYDTLAGAIAVLRAHGCVLAGGHTTEGAEFTFGLTVNGYGVKKGLLRKSGMKPGDSIILTKPLGTGLVFAADMRGKARGDWVAGAIGVMLQSNRDAVECLRAHGANACTDVTGFGLAGHLIEMADASRANVELRLSDVRVLEGVSEIVGMGIASSLYDANARLRRRIANLDSVNKMTGFPVLFDPQTAGGFLGSVPSERAEACVEALRKSEYMHAAIIGTCTGLASNSEPSLRIV